MRVLLDENLPHDLRHELLDHDVQTVAFRKWQGLGNGALLARAAADGFDVVLTKDTKLRYQQNIGSLPVSVIVIEAASNAMDDIRRLVPQIRVALRDLRPRSLVAVP